MEDIASEHVSRDLCIMALSFKYPAPFVKEALRLDAVGYRPAGRNSA